jgi:hypothetical protein
VYETVYCSECSKPVKAVPAWLATVDVRFSCESCRQKHPKAYAPVELAGVRPLRADDEDVVSELPVDEEGIVDPIDDEVVEDEVVGTPLIGE